MEIKLVCECGQKFKFDADPVNGVMPFTVNCPSCSKDNTGEANSIIAQTSAAEAPTGPPGGGIRINRPQRIAIAVPASGAVASPRPLAAVATPAAKATGEFNLGLGILGTLLGAGVGVGLMYGFYAGTGVRFPLLGVGIGALSGYGAKLLYKGTDHLLGVISAVVALVGVVGTLWLMYGEFPIMNIISVVVSVSVAYRIASG